MNYFIRNMVYEDIDEAKTLIPKNWGDSTDILIKYVNDKNAHPIVVERDGAIIGMGCALFYEGTAWFGHIVVKREMQRQGIGDVIVSQLIQLCKQRKIQTISLIASKEGEGLYLKFGFVKEEAYVYMERVTTVEGVDRESMNNADRELLPVAKEEYEQILALDEAVTNEKRSNFLLGYLEHAYVYKQNDKICGFYVPTLGEGVMIASNEDAGMKLLEATIDHRSRFVLPHTNTFAVGYLVNHGFKCTMSVMRMYYGDKRTVKYRQIYSRIGGNLG